KGLRRAERHADDLAVLVGNPVQVGDAIEQAVQHRPGLHPCQVHAEATVNAAGERDVRAPCAVDVKYVRVGPARFVAVGGAHAQVDLRALSDGHTVDLDGSGGGARNADERRLV